MVVEESVKRWFLIIVLLDSLIYIVLRDTCIESV